MDIANIYNDDVDEDGYTDSVPSLKSLVFDKKKRFIIKFSWKFSKNI